MLGEKGWPCGQKDLSRNPANNETSSLVDDRHESWDKCNTASPVLGPASCSCGSLSAPRFKLLNAPTAVAFLAKLAKQTHVEVLGWRSM